MLLMISEWWGFEALAIMAGELFRCCAGVGWSAIWPGLTDSLG